MAECDHCITRVYLDTLVHGHKREHELMAEAVERASEVVAARLEHLNALREQMNAAEAKFLTRVEYRVQHEAVERTQASQSKLIYAGLGIVLALQFAIGIIIVLIDRGMK